MSLDPQNSATLSREELISTWKRIDQLCKVLPQLSGKVLDLLERPGDGRAEELAVSVIKALLADRERIVAGLTWLNLLLAVQEQALESELAARRQIATVN